MCNLCDPGEYYIGVLLQVLDICTKYLSHIYCSYKYRLKQFYHVCTILVIYLSYTGAAAATTEFVVAASEVHYHSSLFNFSRMKLLKFLSAPQ